MKSTLILISGPSGSGKTALAEHIAKYNDFAMISEDRLWGDLKADCPVNEGRTLEEEILIQNKVITQIREMMHDGKNVVLEFILYCDPPRPLLVYKEAFKAIASNIAIVLLKPSIEAILSRKKIRARENEQDEIAETNIATSQIRCLESSHIERSWIIENHNISIPETYNLIMERLPKKEPT